MTKSLKRAKYLFAFLAAAVLAFALAAPAFADGEGGDEGGGDATTTKTITLTGGKAGHTYTLYQIFTGTVDGDELVNIQWGDGVTAAYTDQFDTAAAAAKAIAADADARATAQDLVAGKAGENETTISYLQNGRDVSLTADGNVVFDGLVEGYYLIVDTNNNQNGVEGDYSSAYIVQVVKDVNTKIKGSAATSDKEIIDSEGEAAENDAAAYAIGDAVPFQLNATTADNVAAYKKYHITFQDKLSDGLDAPTSFDISVLGHDFEDVTTDELAEGVTWTSENGTKVTVKSATPAEGYSFAITVEFEPAAVGETPAATYLNAECNSTPIAVNYTSVLNENAEIGLPGNPNDMHITYSNNPESDDDSEEGSTPEDTVKVFTYKTVVDKVDAEGHALEGAGFTIYQEVPEDTEGAETGATIKAANAEAIEDSALADAKYYVAKAMTTVNGNDAQFEFDGLADGTYVLVETVIPDGFNAFKSVEFTISSEVTETAITTLEGTTPFTTTNPGQDGAVQADKKDGTQHNLASGELYTEIENNSGAELPSTGGMGTTILYIVGGIMILGAVVFLITRRRAAKAAKSTFESDDIM